MAPRALKLGTRRSALARAQSAAVARELERRHPGLRVELMGIDTRGDRILDQPLSAIEGKEFFTAEIDAALLSAEVDLTVHSCKDLSLVRSTRLHLGAVPPRAAPHDVVVFAPDVAARLAAGEPIVIGSSSPRRASFVPDFLQAALPHAGVQAPRVQLVELRGNVDSRLRRLREPRDSARHLDGVVLAFAGLARLWDEQTLRPTLGPLLSGLPRMVLPLSLCPAAPAQGALAIECRSDDAATIAVLATLDDASTRQAVQAERELLAAHGGGCQQRFGATLIEVPGLGRLLYSREAIEQVGELELQPTRLRWLPSEPLPASGGAVRSWDGTRMPAPRIEPLAVGIARAAAELPRSAALFVAHRRALPSDDPVSIAPGVPVWVPGMQTWRALAQRGVWVEGCAEGLGFGWLAATLLAQPWLQLPALADWTILTHAQAAAAWREGHVIATYRHASAPEQGGPPPDATHVYWSSGAQYDHWHERLGKDAQHACGPGKTFEHLRSRGAPNLRMFPGVEQWRDWLRS